jgi:hypothetical protein
MSKENTEALSIFALTFYIGLLHSWRQYYYIWASSTTMFT